MKCPNCGAEIGHGDRYCKYCGGSVEVRPQPAPVPQQITVHVNQPAPQVVEVHHYHEVERTLYVPQRLVSPKSRPVSLILCLGFGLLGVHKFYEGKVALGLLYLFSCGLLGFGVVVDLLRLLLGRPVDGRGLPITWRR